MVVGGNGYQRAVDTLLASYQAIPPGNSVRLSKKTSNLFRGRNHPNGPGLDVSGLTGVLAIDAEQKTADVGGMCTYEDLVAATLPLGLSPLVIPQLKTITVGGAVTGLGIESASFRNGLVHESVLELDILTGAGDVVTATADNDYADLFHGFPNSYGTLGYATRVRLELEAVPEIVELEHLRFNSFDKLQRAIADITETGQSGGREVHYLDGVVFSPIESYLTMGTFAMERQGDPSPPKGRTSDYTGRQIFYRSLQQRAHDRLSVAGYLWRWDTDWFWCSRAFGAQLKLLRLLWPKRLLRSSFYWKLVALDRRWGIADRVEKIAGRTPLERVVQDVEIPLENAAEFLRWFSANVPISPIWVCPLRVRPRGHDGNEFRDWPLYPLDPEVVYVNFGFWSVVSTVPGDVDGATNRLIEHQVSTLGGHKSLYSDAYYSRPEFRKLYGGESYDVLKSKYDPDGRLSDLYAKTVQRA